MRSRAGNTGMVTSPIQCENGTVIPAIITEIEIPAIPKCIVCNADVIGPEALTSLPDIKIPPELPQSEVFHTENPSLKTLCTVLEAPSNLLETISPERNEAQDEMDVFRKSFYCDACTKKIRTAMDLKITVENMQKELKSLIRCLRRDIVLSSKGDHWVEEDNVSDVTKFKSLFRKMLCQCWATVTVPIPVAYQTKIPLSISNQVRQGSPVVNLQQQGVGSIISNDDSARIDTFQLVETNMNHDDDDPISVNADDLELTSKINEILNNSDKPSLDSGFRCTICSLSFLNAGGLGVHSRKKHGILGRVSSYGGPETCEFCKKDFRKLKFPTSQKGQKIYTCDIQGCKKILPTYNRFKRHHRETCPKREKSKKLMKIQRQKGLSDLVSSKGKSEIDLPEGKQCDVCNLYFISAVALGIHRRRTHGIHGRSSTYGGSNFCEYCQQDFSQVKFPLSESGDKIFACDIPGCSKISTSFNYFKKHHRDSCPQKQEMKKSFEEQITETRRKTQLQKKLQQKIDKINENPDCSELAVNSDPSFSPPTSPLPDDCGDSDYLPPSKKIKPSRATKRPSSTHKKKAAKKEPFSKNCDVCHKHFTSAVGYGIHRRNAHNIVGRLGKYGGSNTCEYCQKNFLDVCFEEDDDGDKIYKCDIPGCERMLTSFNTFKMHHRHTCPSRKWIRQVYRVKPLKQINETFVVIADSGELSNQVEDQDEGAPRNESITTITAIEEPDEVPRFPPNYKQCDICKELFPTGSALGQHRRNVHNILGRASSRGGSDFCEFCNKQFLDVEFPVDDDGHKIFACDIPDCPKVLPTFNQYKQHHRKTCPELRRLRDKEKNQDFPCTYEGCGRVFRRSYSLKAHQMSVHEEKFRFQCEICGLGFQSPNSLRRHRTVHEEKRFQCEDCGFRCRLQYELTYHKKIHRNEFPHLCQICGRGFLYSKSLKVHMFSHSETKDHPCPECGKMFASPYYVRYHIQVVHQRIKLRKWEQAGIAKPGREKGKAKTKTVTVQEQKKRGRPILPAELRKGKYRQRKSRTKNLEPVEGEEATEDEKPATPKKRPRKRTSSPKKAPKGPAKSPRKPKTPSSSPSKKTPQKELEKLEDAQVVVPTLSDIADAASVVEDGTVPAGMDFHTEFFSIIQDIDGQHYFVESNVTK